MNQFTVAVTTGTPSTSAPQWNRRAATSPGSITPIGESIGAVATATSWASRSSGSAAKPSSATTIRTDGRKPPASRAAIGLPAPPPAYRRTP